MYVEEKCPACGGSIFLGSTTRSDCYICEDCGARWTANEIYCSPAEKKTIERWNRTFERRQHLTSRYSDILTFQASPRKYMADLSKKRAKFLPMPGRLAVEPIEEERYGGLILPPSKEKATLGTITWIPNNPAPNDLELGDVVLFGANSGMAVEVGLGANRRKAIFLRESEIISKVEWEDVQAVESLTSFELVCSHCGREDQQVIDSEAQIRICRGCNTGFSL